MPEFVLGPWPWYIVGPLIGLMVPLLLIAGNKSFGISSSLRHICAACFPGRINYFRYDWRKEAWNLFFACGIIAGGAVASIFLSDHRPITVNPGLQHELEGYRITNYNSLVPLDIFNWEALRTVRGFIFLVVGGFLVGFGTRYAGGCTSGHSIMGLSQRQWPSLVATVCFMAGGFFMANMVIPVILKL